MSIIKDMKDLLKQANADNLTRYSTEWQGNAVATLNEYYMDHDRYDDEIYDADGEMWEDIVKHNLENRGATGLLFLLAKIEPADDYVALDGYGNGKGVHADDLVDRLEWAIDELESEED